MKRIRQFRITEWIPRLGNPEQMSSGMVIVHGVEHEFVFDRELGDGYRYLVRHRGQAIYWFLLYWNAESGVVDSVRR